MRRILVASVAAVIAGVIVAIVVLGGGDGDDGQPERVAGVPLDDVARRVEEIRGLRFRERPRVEVLGQERLEEVIEDASRSAVREQPERVEGAERAAAALGALLAVAAVVEQQDVERLAGVDDLQLGGVYLPGERRAYLVRESVRESRRQAETILAHELTHVLEDQHFGGFEPGIEAVSDSQIARHALQEGSAGLVDARYAARHLGADDAAGLLERRRRRVVDSDAPEGLQPLLTFPYLDGARFARALLREGSGRELLNAAQRRPPETTEQVLHPEKWRRREGAERVSVSAESTLGDGWRRLGGGDLGELHTTAILRADVPLSDARRAAAGWGGGAFEIWYRGEPPVAGCDASCRRRSVAAMAWRWDDANEAREFLETARAYVARAPEGSAAAVAASGDRTAVTIAPSQALADEIARRSLEGG